MPALSNVKSSGAGAIAIGQNGSTNPALQVDSSAASQATGVKLVGKAAASGAAIAAISSGTDENLTIDAKGAGTISLNATGTGAIALARNTTVTGTLVQTVASATAKVVGPNGTTNPSWQIDTSASSAATGIKITAKAAASGAAIAVISSGTNENLTIDAKGSGTVTINGTGTGDIALARNVTIAGTNIVTSSSATANVVGPNGTTNPAFQVDASAGSAATGVKVTANAAASGAAVTVISSGTNENLTVDAKGSGTITLNGTGTGAVTTPRALTSTGATAGIGYATGAGGTVTQATNRTTGVTLNKVTGTITTNSTSLAAGSSATFTVTNSAVAITDVVNVAVQSGLTTVDTLVYVTAVAAGSFNITVRNNHASTAETGAILINFAVMKAVAA